MFGAVGYTLAKIGLVDSVRRDVTNTTHIYHVYKIIVVCLSVHQ